MKPILYYIHDPMCSWCWGFRPVWEQVQGELEGKVAIQYVLGGLAPDTDQPMSENMQISIRDNWRRIQQEIPGTEFNYDFWSLCRPRRSTYISCRAVIATRMQRPELDREMISAIQQAYYLEAKNPSDSAQLIQLSSNLGLNSEQFKTDLLSDKCEQLLQQELQMACKLSISSFPSLVLNCNGSNTLIYIDYTNSETIVSSLLANMQ